jgi:hypothetical protein
LVVRNKRKKAINLDALEKTKKIALKLDITIMNMMIGIIFKKDSLLITRKNLINIKKLIDLIDPVVFDDNESLEARYKFINKALEAKLEKGFEQYDTIINFCKNAHPSNEIENIISNIFYYVNIKSEEIKHINNAVEDRIRHSYLMVYKDILYECMERLDSGDYDSFEEVNDLTESIISSLLTKMRKARTVNSLNTLSLDDENIDLVIEDIVNTLKNPFRILRSGVQKLNQILAGGFFSKRLYTFLGLPALIINNGLIN